jgi:hypothetical protein
LRIFALVGALLLAVGAFLLVDAGLRISKTLAMDTFTAEVWRREFWLNDVDDVEQGMSPNGHWFLRLGGGMLICFIGAKILKVATK